MNSVKQQVIAAAELLGAKVNHGGTGSDFEITIDAPDGFHWMADGVHQIVESIWDDEKPINLWADALDRIGHGLERCDYSDVNCADTAGLDHPDLAPGPAESEVAR